MKGDEKCDYLMQYILILLWISLKDATKKEIEALQMESELPLEDLLKSLPKEMLEKPSSDLPFDDDSSDDSASSLVRFVFMLDLECDFF